MLRFSPSGLSNSFAISVSHDIGRAEADEFAFEGGDKGAREARVAKALGDGGERGVGADRAWPGAHCLLDCLSITIGECAAAEAAEDDPLLVDDDACVPARGADALADRVEWFVKLAGWDVLAGVLTGSRGYRVAAFDRESGCEPGCFASGKVVDIDEVEAFEPRRGSWAHVSQVVPAVDDHRSYGVKQGDPSAVELFERDVERARKVRLGVLRGGQHLHELRAGCEQPLCLVPVDRGRHPEHHMFCF